MNPVLDACCGSRMFWFNPKDPRAVFVDCRRLETTAIWKSGNGKATRYCTVKPDVIAVAVVFGSCVASILLFAIDKGGRK